VDRSGDIPSKPVVGIEIPPRVGGSYQHLNKDAADRALYSIVSRFTNETPRSKKGVQVWTRAKEVREELTASLNEVGWHLEGGLKLSDIALEAAGKAKPTKEDPPPMDPAFAFMPPGWSRQLTEELVAELVVDSCVSSYADALIDGAVVLIEAMLQEKNAALNPKAKSQSESTLERRPPLARQPRGAGQVRKADARSKSATQIGGFALAGLPRDSLEAWKAIKYHPCQDLEPYRTRISLAVEEHRPRKRVDPRASQPPDLRKYNWPMMKTDLPHLWNATSASKAEVYSIGHIRRGKVARNFPPPLRVDRQGRTCFPYSLVSHRAFLNAQPDENLREQASRIAPLRTTTQW